MAADPHGTAAQEASGAVGHVARFIASGFGSGFCPVGPGTAGSLVALLIGAGLLHVSIWALAAACALAAIGGVCAIAASGATGDPGWVVIDEFAGQFLAMLALSRPTLPGLLAAFVLFRALDVLKPGPVGWADRQGGAIGVMADDLVAGAIVAILLGAARVLAPGYFL